MARQLSSAALVATALLSPAMKLKGLGEFTAFAAAQPGRFQLVQPVTWLRLGPARGPMMIHDISGELDLSSVTAAAAAAGGSIASDSELRA